MGGLRARVRAELTAEIKSLARRQMATGGASSLSLRAIARELGMVSSAVYRYFPSRDDLLTALIIDSYDELGSLAESADAEMARDDMLGRWMRISQAAYLWAKANPAEYGLIFGTPVPGYAAPVDTVGPATRLPLVLMALLVDAHRLGIRPAVEVVATPALRADLRSMVDALGVDVDDATLLAGLSAWMGLFGTISFVLFGQLNNVIDDYDEYFGVASAGLGRQVFDVEGTSGAPPAVEAV